MAMLPCLVTEGPEAMRRSGRAGHVIGPGRRVRGPYGSLNLNDARTETNGVTQAERTTTINNAPNAR